MQSNHHETTSRSPPESPLVPSLSKDGAPQSKEASPVPRGLRNV